jgi:hypothetical protein
MSDWYIAIPNRDFHGMEDARDMEGVYCKGRILPTGSIVPLEWKGRQAINELYLPAGYLEEYTPSHEDMALLYMLWPAIRPHGFSASLVDNMRVGSPGKWASGWYQIQAPHAKSRMCSVPYGVAALMDVEGVCKAGDIALVGDVVPAPFFAGLTMGQFDRLETTGLTSLEWLARFPSDNRAEYIRKVARPVIARIAVASHEKEALLEKFPAMNPNAVQEVPKAAKTIKRKG